MENIKNIDSAVSKNFPNGNIVFIIYENEKIKGMVNTKEDYEKKLFTHQYNPLLFIVPLHVKIAYLYGCLNYQYQISNGNTYRIMWREIKKDEWRLWFTVIPYQEVLYTA
jgi:hypothetical protein